MNSSSSVMFVWDALLEWTLCTWVTNTERFWGGEQSVLCYVCLGCVVTVNVVYMGHEYSGLYSTCGSIV
jgi:hypothetical protein